MKIEFSGGSGTVTGSSHLLKINGKNVLLDCGLYQGKDEKTRGNDVFPFIPSKIDYIVLSHAHIDHSGRIPLLYKRGFRGKIFLTPPAKDLATILLLDSAHIHEQDAEWENKKRERKNLTPIEPLYDLEDAKGSIKCFKELEFNKKYEIFDGFTINFKEAGHMLGAAITEIFIDEEGKEYKLVYSGDLGNKNIPLIKDPDKIDDTDFLIIETTYGNRLHPNSSKEHEELLKIINETYKRGGNTIIPSFAVGRTQELIYILNEFMKAGRLEKGVKIYVDSPLASKSTEIFKKNKKYFDEESQKKIKRGENLLDFPNLYFTESVEDSIVLNNTKRGAVIISASGMATAGRIRHHLKHNLWRKECSVIFVGYQAEGSLGRIIQEGANQVTLFGDEIKINAEVHSFTGLSGHADRNGLYEWIKSFKNYPKEIFLTHGEPEAREAMRKLLVSEGYDVKVPNQGYIASINEDINIKSLTTDFYEYRSPVEVAIKNLRTKEKLIKYIENINFDNESINSIINQLEKILLDR